ncbi:MAG: hypothetical protein ABR529_08390 [Actinomycetota bacterium]
MLSGRKVMILIAVGMVTALSGGVAAQAGGGGAPTVEIVGGIEIAPNEYLQLTLRFDPEDVDVASGGRVRWVETADLKEPHTVTIVREGALPENFEEAEACYAPGHACARALKAHEKKKGVRRVVEAKGSKKGLDEVRDSRWIKPNKTIRPTISAPAGETLYYLCATHPWMQGSVTTE